MKNESNLLKEYKILSILGIPFFAIKNDEERSELQSIIRLKLKEIKGLEIIPEPNLTALEERFDDICDEEKKYKKWSFKKIKCVIQISMFMFYFLIKHFVIRIGIRKKICEQEINMFYESSIETIEYTRIKRIKKLAGIK